MENGKRTDVCRCRAMPDTTPPGGPASAGRPGKRWRSVRTGDMVLDGSLPARRLMDTDAPSAVVAQPVKPSAVMVQPVKPSAGVGAQPVKPDSGDGVGLQRGGL